MVSAIIQRRRSGFRSAGAALRSRRLRRLPLLALATSFVLGAGHVVPAAAGVVRVQAEQQLALLFTAHRAYLAPSTRSVQTAFVPANRPITGERTTLPVVGQATGLGGRRWLHVMLPGRPNGSTGWISQQGTRRLETGWHLVVNLARRHVTAYRDGHVVRSFQAVVGKPSTPTPTGAYFVEETVKMARSEPGGPFALATSARSNVLQEFEGGPGQIALHGLNNLGGTPGNAESHGCIRVGTQSIDWLIARIEPGTPVTIYRG